MERRTPSTRFVAILIAILALNIAPVVLADGGDCSLRSVSGDYGYTTTGTRLGVGPVAGVGRFSADRDGNLVGQQTVSFNGNIAAETFTGTWTVNDDCSGSSTIYVVSPFGNRTSTLNVVWVDHSKEARAIFTNSQTIITIGARKISND